MAFEEIFTNNETVNKMDNYDWTWLHQDEKAGLLATSVDAFITKEIERRSRNCRNQMLVASSSQIQEEKEEDGQSAALLD